jgi:hypothetical protein
MHDTAARVVKVTKQYRELFCQVLRPTSSVVKHPQSTLPLGDVIDENSVNALKMLLLKKDPELRRVCSYNYPYSKPMTTWTDCRF